MEVEYQTWFDMDLSETARAIFLSNEAIYFGILAMFF